MLTNLKALVVILCLAWVAFRYARPLCLQCVSEATFKRRRNVWFALTIVAFLSPAFWVYALFALVVLWWAAKHDSNPLALYLLVVFAVPNARYFIPTVLIGQLFDLTQFARSDGGILILTEGCDRYRCCDILKTDQQQILLGAWLR